MTDYEEQVLITGVKSGRHCTICQVPSNKREDLLSTWPKRTHSSTKAQIKEQRSKRVQRTDEAWIHDVHNFAWSHHLVNIHDIMSVDILHQLLKGIVMRLIEWIQELVPQILPRSRKRKQGDLRITTARPSAQLDHRFSQVPSFPGLKTFKHFSAVKQWTGVEQKAIVRQLLPVITPLFVHTAPMAVLFARAVLDFVMMAQYRTHDAETLRYMDHALYRMDKLKEIFRGFRPVDKDTNQGHFNFPKFHVITHYPEFIRRFGGADGSDTSHPEAAHKYLLKAFYGRTNKREGFLTQILHHNTRRTRMQAMEDVLLSQALEPFTISDQVDDVKVTRPTKMRNLQDLNWILSDEDRHVLRQFGLERGQWRRASQIAREADLPYFVDALATFISRSRDLSNRIPMADRDPDIRQRDPVWAGDLFISVHPSLRCWKPSGEDPGNPDALTDEIIRCTPYWQRASVSKWRRDFVWVQEYATDGDASASTLNGKRVGQLQLIFTAYDPEQLDDTGQPARVTGAFVKLLKPRKHGQYHEVHGMIELELPPNPQPNSRTLGPNRIYDMTTILRSAHVVPATLDTSSVFLLNNYIDWHQYNDLYDEDWLDKGTRQAERLQREYLRKERI